MKTKAYRPRESKNSIETSAFFINKSAVTPEIAPTLEKNEKADVLKEVHSCALGAPSVNEMTANFITPAMVEEMLQKMDDKAYMKKSARILKEALEAVKHPPTLMES